MHYITQNVRTAASLSITFQHICLLQHHKTLNLLENFYGALQKSCGFSTSVIAASLVPHWSDFCSVFAWVGHWEIPSSAQPWVIEPLWLTNACSLQSGAHECCENHTIGPSSLCLGWNGSPLEIYPPWYLSKLSPIKWAWCWNYIQTTSRVGSLGGGLEGPAISLLTIPHLLLMGSDLELGLYCLGDE